MKVDGEKKKKIVYSRKGHLLCWSSRKTKCRCPCSEKTEHEKLSNATSAVCFFRSCISLGMLSGEVKADNFAVAANNPYTYCYHLTAQEVWGVSLAWTITCKSDILFDTLKCHLYWSSLDVIKRPGNNSLMETHEKHRFIAESWVFSVTS